MYPDFAIIGAQKAGSTALTRYLDTHDEVFLPRRETRYFRDPWYGFESSDVLSDALAPAPAGTKRYGIKCPDLLGTPSAPERVAAVLGPIDLLVILREPAARAISAYHHYMHLGMLPIVEANAGLTALLDGRVDARYPRAREILEFGLYAQSLRRWFEHVDRDRVLIDTDDELRHDRDACLGRALEFLGVSPLPAGQVVERSANEGVYSIPRLKFLQLRYPFMLTRYPGDPGRYLRMDDRRTPRELTNLAIRAFDRRVLIRVFGNTKPTISAAVRRRLAEYYAPDVADLRVLLGREFAGW